MTMGHEEMRSDSLCDDTAGDSDRHRVFTATGRLEPGAWLECACVDVVTIIVDFPLLFCVSINHQSTTKNGVCAGLSDDTAAVALHAVCMSRLHDQNHTTGELREEEMQQE